MFNAKGKVYACSDLHGNYNLWKQISDYCKLEDTIFFLGDATDRGKEGLKILKDMFTDDRVVFIKGNHEQMIEDCYSHETGFYYDFDKHEEIRLWTENGGWSTWDSILEMSMEGQHWLYGKLKQLSISCSYVNKNGEVIFLSHAGVSPDAAIDLGSREDQEELMWNRSHFINKWTEGYDNLYIIHGHTPVQVLEKRIKALNPELTIQKLDDSTTTAIRYADGHKIDIDLGTCISNKVILLDLDELTIAETFYDLEEN